MKKIAYYFSFIPLQLNFFVFAFILVIVNNLVQSDYFASQEKQYYTIIMFNLDKFILIFSAVMVCLGLLTTLASFLFFWLYKSSMEGSPVEAMIGEGKSAQAGYVGLGLRITGLIKPFLGHVKGRIVFADQSITPALSLDQPFFTKSRIIRSGLKASRPVWIPDIKEHEVKRVVLYFEDMFRIFSFPFVIKNVQKLMTLPPEASKLTVQVNPDKTVEQEQRIETPKRIQGELFNYKHFEAGDDIRRIVWKIYARNKELVVKVPETMDPYASHIYFHPSFYASNMIGPGIRMTMLNYYKTKIRQIYEALMRTEFSVKYIPDQELNIPDQESEENPKWLYQLSTSSWQSEREVTDAMMAKREGIYCLSSLVPAQEVEEILANKNPDTLVFFVKVSEMWKSRHAFNFLSLFMKTEEHPLDAMKRQWLFSPGRKKILQNEKQIEKYLEDQLFKNMIL